MAATKGSVPDSMNDGLQQLLPDIALCMGAPDADMAFLNKLQTAVLLRLHQPAKPNASGPAGSGPAGAPGGPPGAGGPAGPGGMPGGQAGGGAPNPAMPGGGAPTAPTEPGGVSKPMTPDPDEMRRILAQQASE